MSKNLFKNKAYERTKVGEWIFEWFIDKKHIERSYMRISGESGLFEMRVKANAHVFGYLLAAARQGLTNQLHGYIASIYIPAMGMTQDQQLTDDIQNSIQKWLLRKQDEGAQKAAAVTDHEEAAAQAYMEDIVSELDMSKKELAEKRKLDKEIMKEIIRKEGEE